MPTADLIYPDKVIRSNYDEAIYNGTWTQNQADNSGHNTSIKYAVTSTVNSAVTIRPSSEWADMFIYASAGKSLGIMDVYLDDAFYTSVDCYMLLDGTNVMRNASVLRITAKRGTHVVKIVCSGNKNADSTGITIGFSHAYVMDPDTTLDVKLNSYLAAGDSITDSISSYADKWLKRLVSNLYPSSKVRYEYATRPGVTSQYVAKWIENELLSKRIAFMSLLIGTNDLSQPKIDTKVSIQHVIDVCEKLDVGLVLCTIPPRAGSDAYYVSRVNGYVKELASKNNLLVADFNSVIFNNVQTTASPINSDGIHPDQVGHSQMGKLLFDVVMLPECGFRNLLK